MSYENVKVSIIVAFSNELTIGRDGGMPWVLREDLKRFKSMTMDKPVIMGRKTFESLGRPLPGRTNIVVTKQYPTSFPEGVLVFDTLEAAIDAGKKLAYDKGLGEVYVIGGGQIYAQAIDLADYIYATHIIANIDGDTKFPAIPMDRYEVFVSVPGPAVDDFNTFPTVYVSYHRK
ncbi:Dihydrofolate reductase type 3 [compost metagenome]